VIASEGGRDRPTFKRANGNVIVDTREFYILVDGQPYLLPLHGTGHRFAREWTTRFHQYRHPKTGEVMPAFARRYTLVTVSAKNALGEWFGLRFIDNLGWVSVAEYEAAKTVNVMIEQGAFRVETPIADDDGGDDNSPPAAA
jgi:hypothetical protein